MWFADGGEVSVKESCKERRGKPQDFGQDSFYPLNKVRGKMRNREDLASVLWGRGCGITMMSWEEVPARAGERHLNVSAARSSAVLESDVVECLKLGAG